MERKKVIESLSFELTRRCNLRCNFCSRGEAQNIDISKNIIDKTFDEVKTYEIGSIRLHGGEPFLMPEVIEYIIEQIITRKINVRQMHMFTNGTIANEKIRNALKKFLNYINKNSSYQENIEYNTPIYKGVTKEGVYIIVSSYHHNVNADVLNKTISFYEEINDKKFRVLKQNESFNLGEYGTFISGLAVENYKDLINSPVDMEVIRIINNNYYLMRNNEQIQSISKTLTVSANGNVFPGCSQEYQQVDENPMFNINECDDNFIEKVQEWSWEHPVNLRANSFRQRYLAAKWCTERGIKVKGFEGLFEKLLDQHYKDTFISEKYAKNLHKRFPEAEFEMIDLTANAILAYQMIDNKCDKFIVQRYLQICTFFPKEMIDNISKEYLFKMIMVGIKELKLLTNR